MTRALCRCLSLAMLLALAGGLAACAQIGPRHVNGTEVVDVMSAFRSGELRLTCDTACSGAWGSNRREAKGYDARQMWPDLVRVIAKVGMRVDSGYYYLGRAAEGQRHTDAARVYYQLALATTFKCAGLFNNCDGVDVPREATAALARLGRGGNDGLRRPPLKPETSGKE